MNHKNAELRAYSTENTEITSELFESVKAARAALKEWLKPAIWARRFEIEDFHTRVASVELYIENEFEEQFIPQWVHRIHP